MGDGGEYLGLLDWRDSVSVGVYDTKNGWPGSEVTLASRHWHAVFLRRGGSVYKAGVLIQKLEENTWEETCFAGLI